MLGNRLLTMRLRRRILLLLVLGLLYAGIDYILYTGHTPCLNLTHILKESCGQLQKKIVYDHEGRTNLSKADADPRALIHDTRLHRNHVLSSTELDRLLHADSRLQRGSFTQCAAVASNDAHALQEAKHYLAHSKPAVTAEEFILMTSDCTAFRSARGYLSKSVSKEEMDFPIAYSILMYKDIEQVEQLLRNIYRPHNFYCIHVDRKTDDVIHAAMTAIAQCLPHVIMLEPRLDVRWGTYTVIEPDLLCMKKLLRYKNWQYFINLTGQEFPLKTNREIVNILKSFKGTNAISAMVGAWSWRTKHRFDGLKAIGPKSPPPANMTIGKGANAVVVSRAFVQFLFSDKTAQEFISWAKDTFIPDETIFASLSVNPQLRVPGSHAGGSPDVTSSLIRLKIWNPNKPRPFWYLFDDECKGRYVHTICIFGIGDLPRLVTSNALFANKFHADFDPLVLACLDEILVNRTRENIRLSAGDGSSSSKLSYRKHPSLKSQ